jgi:hypothetical protein
MGSSKKSREHGVTRTLPERMPEAVRPHIGGAQITQREDGCPTEVDLDIHVPSADVRAVILVSSEGDVPALLADKVRVRIGGPVGRSLQRCMREGKRYTARIISRKKEKGGTRLAVKITRS